MGSSTDNKSHQNHSSKMKTAFILLIAACSMAYEVQPSKVTYSDEAQQKIQVAKENLIAELCFEQQPEPEIYETICLTAAVAALGQPVTYNANCMSCSNADPICMNSCPLIFEE